MELNPIQKSLNIAYQPHPVAPLADRKLLVAEINGMTSVRRVLLMAGIDPHQPITVQLDGQLLTVEEWDSVYPSEGQLLSVHATVQGGGGDGSNVVMIVAMIAIMVAAPYVGAAFAASTGAVAGTTAFATTAALGSAIFSIAGSLVIGAIFAPKPPSAPNTTATTVSPTYSLSGGSNRARPYEPMPVVFGTHRLFLDYSARPYSEYRGEDQYLYQIFNLGLGNVSATDYKIGTTSLSSYADVEFITPDATGRLLNFPGNVDSSAGGVLTNSAGYITRTTSANTYSIGIDLESVAFFANNKGGLNANSISFEIQYKLSDTSVFINATNMVINSTGSYTNEGAGVVKVTAATQKPQRATIFIPVSVGTYDVRVRRLSADSTDQRSVVNSSWALLRSYQEDTADYRGQNRVGLIIKATEQLNGVVQTLSAIVTAQARYWNGTAFVTGNTDNPAHLFMHFAKGVYNSDNKLMYGVGLSDSQIDYAGLHVWAQFCATEGLTFNGVLDSTQTASDMLNSIATTGFASPTWASGKLGAVFDAPNASPVMAFGMSNIIRDTFQVAYISENLAEELVIRFTNPDKDYEQDEVRTLAPEVVTPLRTSSIDLYGCTDATMAGKFANYLAAQQYYRRRRVTWQSDFEGFVCQRGDVVLLSHDLTQWGYSGRFIGVNNNVITLDRTVPRQNQVEYLMLIRPDGSTSTYDVQATTSTESDTLTIINDVVTLQAGANLIDHRWTFSPLETVGKKLKILSVQPASDARLTIVATDESEEFYTAWGGTFTPPRTDTILPSQPVTATNLTVTNRIAVVDGFLTNRVAISWGVGGGTLYSQVKIYLNGNLIGQVADTRVPYYELDINASGSLFVEVTPFGLLGAGITQTSTVNIAELDLPLPPTAVTLEVGEDGRSATFAWTTVAGVQSYVVEIFANGAVKRSVNVGNTLSYVYSVADAVADGGAFRSYQVRVYSVNLTGQSTTYASANFNNPQIGQLVNASIDPMPNSLWFSATRPTEDDYEGILIWISKTLGFTPTNAELIYEGDITDVTLSAYTDGQPLETGEVYYIRAAAYDTFGKDSLTLTGELAATILSPAWGLIQGDIDESVLSAGLNERIDLIDADATVIGSLANIQAQLQGQIDDLNDYPEYSDTVTYQEGDIVKYNNAIYSATQTTTGNLPTNTTYWTKIGDYSSLGDAVAAHTNQIQVLTNNDITQATQITNLISSTNTNASAITAETTARTTADTALASSITTLQSTVSGNSAAIVTEQTTRANADSALSSSITTLASTVGENSTAISTNATVVNGIESKYTVKIDNNGYVSGYGLISTANNATPFSEFIVVADRFAIAPVATNPTAVDGSPFFVLTSPTVIDGTTIPAGTYMKKAFIHDATITTAKIENLAVVDAKIANLNATKITAGFISADRIQVGSIDAKIANIEAAKITSGVIDVARIGDASITNAKILNLDATKITTGFLDANRINVGSIDAKIATINNAQIANLAVDTLKIQSNAVTVPVNVASNSTTTGKGFYETVIGTVVTNTSSVEMPVILIFSAAVGYSAGIRTTGFRLFANGSILVDYGVFTQAFVSFPCYQVYHTIGAGQSATYIAEFFGQDSTVAMGYRALTALGVKR